ncbi:o-linked n-acetyl glucosamine transferase, partial [Lasius niger]
MSPPPISSVSTNGLPQMPQGNQHGVPNPGQFHYQGQIPPGPPLFLHQAIPQQQLVMQPFVNDMAKAIKTLQDENATMKVILNELKAQNASLLGENKKLRIQREEYLSNSENSSAEDTSADEDSDSTVHEVDHSMNVDNTPELPFTEVTRKRGKRTASNISGQTAAQKVAKLTKPPQKPSGYDFGASNLQGNTTASTAPLKNDNITQNKNVTNKQNVTNTNTKKTNSLPKKSGNLRNFPNIIAYNVSHKELVPVFKTRLGHSNFAFKQLGVSKSLIISYDKPSFKKIKEVLDGRKINYFHQTPNDEKSKLILLKNVSRTFDKDDVVAALEETFRSKDFSNVSKFVPPTRYTNSKPNRYKNTHIWQIQVAPGIDVSGVMKADFLLGIQEYVKFEFYNSTDIPQCKRCQRYGHITRNCMMTQRCLRCGGNHDKDGCKLPVKAIDPVTKTQTEESLPTCCNCGQKGHPANYRCEAYKKIVRKAKENKAKLEAERREKSQAFNNYTRKEVSYADMVRPKVPTRTQPAPVTNSRLSKANPPPKPQLSPVDTTFYQEIVGAMKLVKTLRPTLEQVQDPEERKAIILFHLLNTNNGYVVLVTETRLHPKIADINIENYALVRNDRNMFHNGRRVAGGGTAIYVKDRLRFDILNLPAFNSIEASGINLKLQDDSSINIFAVYYTPRIRSIIDTNDLTTLATISGNTPFLAGGDYNSKHITWHNPQNCSNGQHIRGWLDNHFETEIFAPREATRGDNVIDFFIGSTSLLTSVTPPQVVTGLSDHEGVILTIRDLNPLTGIPRQILDFKHTNWRVFNRTLDRKLQELLIPEYINLSFDEINNFAEQLQAILVETRGR